jgi:hypothetical protein
MGSGEREGEVACNGVEGGRVECRAENGGLIRNNGMRAGGRAG